MKCCMCFYLNVFFSDLIKKRKRNRLNERVKKISYGDAIFAQNIRRKEATIDFLSKP